MSTRGVPIGQGVGADAPSVLVVCMGNICRSPMAEGILRHHAAKAGLDLRIDSAGTHAYHVGEPPDPRARQVCQRHGLPIDDLRARQVARSDLERFDWILAADRANLNWLVSRLGANQRLHLLLEFAGHAGDSDVPDPYYDGVAEFEQVFDLLDAACARVLRRVTSSA